MDSDDNSSTDTQSIEEEVHIEDGNFEDLFESRVSGFEELRHSDDDDNGEIRGAESDEVDESKLDDAQRENTAIQVYHDLHPEREQLFVGGREIGEHEAIWSVSSFRPHWGPDKLRDNNALTYWQSDCPNPKKNHTVDLSFHQATLIRQVSLFIDYFQDESYTPKAISIRGGTTYRDLHEIMTFECEEIVGWINADITSTNDGNPFRVFRLQIAILNTHSNGRDTHIRQIKVYSILPSYLQEDGNTQEMEEEEEEEEEEAQSITSRKPMINKGIR